MGRIVGTIVGGVLGIGIHHLLGPGHSWWTLVIIVGALTIGAYNYSISYPAFVTFLVIALAQLYALDGEKLDTTLLYRLGENATGAAIAAIIATLVLPVSTYSTVRTGVDGYLQALKTFANNLSAHLTDPDVRIRSDVRAVDHALFQVKDVVSHLFPSFIINRRHSAHRYRRAHAMTDVLTSAVSDVRSLAHNASAASPFKDPSELLTLQRSIDDLTQSISEVQQQLNHQHHNAPTAATKGLAASNHDHNDIGLSSTMLSLNGLASQVALLAQRRQQTAETVTSRPDPGIGSRMSDNATTEP
jgi:uncharacterized membrane protein YccC